MKTKPSWFRLLDAVSLGGPGLATAGLTTLMMTRGYDGPPSALVLMWVVTATFMAIWLRIVQVRRADLNAFVWYPTYGIMIKPETYILPTPAEVDAVIKQVIANWTPIYPDTAKIIADGDVLWAFFKKGLNESDKNPAHKKVKGFTIPETSSMEVDYDSDTDLMTATAFAHELGHVIIGHATGNWNEAWHHAIMREHGLL